MDAWPVLLVKYTIISVQLSIIHGIGYMDGGCVPFFLQIENKPVLVREIFC